MTDKELLEEERKVVKMQHQTIVALRAELHKVRDELLRIADIVNGKLYAIPIK